jgi:hypothetical protein
VRHRGREHAEPPGPAHAAHGAQQHRLGLDQRPRRAQRRERAGAQQRGDLGPGALERGDARLDVADDLLLAEEDRGAVGEPGDQDLVVAGGGQGGDLSGAEAVEDTCLADVHRGPHDRGHLGDDVHPRRLPDGDQAYYRGAPSEGSFGVHTPFLL